MGLTFGGDNGFGVSSKKHIKTQNGPDLKIIKESVTIMESEMKPNMLLSFYDFPKIESSTILTA